MIVRRRFYGVVRLKIGELAEQCCVTKRTIDHYTNLGLLEVERSTSNYRYYDPSMIQRVHWIEDEKKSGKSLQDIKQELLQAPYEEIDVIQLRMQMRLLDQQMQQLMENIPEEEQQAFKRSISKEGVSLMKSLIGLF